MSAIHNEAKIRFPLIVAIREQLEHRALKRAEKNAVFQVCPVGL